MVYCSWYPRVYNICCCKFIPKEEISIKKIFLFFFIFICIDIGYAAPVNITYLFNSSDSYCLYKSVFGNLTVTNTGSRTVLPGSQISMKTNCFNVSDGYWLGYDFVGFNNDGSTRPVEAEIGKAAYQETHNFPMGGSGNSQQIATVMFVNGSITATAGSKLITYVEYVNGGRVYVYAHISNSSNFSTDYLMSPGSTQSSTGGPMAETYTFTDTRTFSYLAFQDSGYDGINSRISYIKLENVTFSNTFGGSSTGNRMPEFNITFTDPAICYNDTGSISYSIPITLNTYDPENDTLYYATDKTAQITTYTPFVTETFDNIEDWFYNGYFSTNYSTHTVTFWILLALNNPLSENFIVPQNEDDNNLLMSEAGTNWIYTLPNYDTSAVTTIRFETTSNDYNNTFSYLFYDTFNTKVENITFDYRDGNLSLYVNDTLIFNNGYHSYGYSDSWITVKLILNNSQDSYKVELWNSSTNKIHDQSYIKPFNGVSYFVFSSIDQPYKRYAIFDDLRVWLDESTNYPSFTIAPINNFTVDSSGYSKLTVYLTDSAHLNSNYTTDSIDFYYEKCKYSTGPGYDVEDLNFNFLWTIKDLGKYLKYYLQDLGYYEIGKSILWLCFIVSLFGLWMLLKFRDFTIPLLASSVGLLLISWWVGYIEHLLTSLILIALALAGPLALHFFGGNR